MIIDKAELKTEKKEKKTNVLHNDSLKYTIVSNRYEYITLYGGFSFSFVFSKYARPPPII